MAGVTIAQAITTLKFRLNRLTNASTAFESQLLLELNLAQERLESDPELPGILLTERASIDLTIDEARVVKPSDFLRENEEDDMQVQDTSAVPGSADDYTELTKRNLDQARRRYPDEERGRPRIYSDSGVYFRLRPIPDKTTYKLWMTYYATAGEITLATIGNPWLTKYPDLLISEAGIYLSRTLGNQRAEALFSTMQPTAKDRLIRNETAIREANFDPNPED